MWRTWRECGRQGERSREFEGGGARGLPKDREGDARGEPEEWEEGCKGVLGEWEEGGAQQGGEDQHQLHHLDDGEKEVCHVVFLTDLRLGIL